MFILLTTTDFFNSVKIAPLKTLKTEEFVNFKLGIIEILTEINFGLILNIFKTQKINLCIFCNFHNSEIPKYAVFRINAETLKCQMFQFGKKNEF